MINENTVGPIYVFIRSHNRPLYLWPCLDSLFRQTRFPCRFIFVDNASTDPGVREVVAGFERRKMFHSVHFIDQNSPSNQNMVFFRHRADLGRYFVLLDSDVVVAGNKQCWLTELIQLAEAYPKLGVLGSFVDQTDFVELDNARELLPHLSDRELVDLVKADSRRAMTAEEDALFGIEKLNVKRSDIPAVTHIDYSARIQTVHADTNPRYHALISAFKERTGCPLVVNTSFNVRGEPIVATPEDAFRCFMGTDIEHLAVGRCILRKENQDPALAENYKDKYELD